MPSNGILKKLPIANLAAEGAFYLALSGAGHFPHLDYPDRFDRVFSEFMTDCGVGIGTGPKAVSS
ncbi:hypothetical protein ACKAMS_08255 [Rhodococcus sp. 5A-K4]|uniref:hypothetical protein n=1 Tax=Rhodococcus sp. 5A-K4 TaxID=3384442 RepID=UPI0038D4FC91